MLCGRQHACTGNMRAQATCVHRQHACMGNMRAQATCVHRQHACIECLLPACVEPYRASRPCTGRCSGSSKPNPAGTNNRPEHSVTPQNLRMGAWASASLPPGPPPAAMRGDSGGGGAMPLLLWLRLLCSRCSCTLAGCLAVVAEMRPATVSCRAVTCCDYNSTIIYVTASKECCQLHQTGCDVEQGHFSYNYL